MSRQLLPSLVMGLLLGGCTVGTDYHSPGIDPAPGWSALGDTMPGKDGMLGLKTDIRMAAAGASADGSVGLWEQFSDKTLTILIDTAMANNSDIEIAVSRLAEARANERGAYAAFFPQIDATAGGGRGKSDATKGEILDTESQAGINASWEIDPAGGNRRRHEAALAAVEAAQGELEDARLSILSEVAINYVRLRSAQKQEAIILKNLKIQRSTLKITENQREDGVVSDLDVVRAQAQVNTTAALLPQIKAARTAIVDRLSTLTRLKIPKIKAITEDAAPIATVSRELVIAAPIDAIARRPDVRAAERRLAQSAALSNAAFAEFFPKLTLAGFFGHANSDRFGSASPWSATVNGLLPLLNFGAIRAQVDAADARQKQAFSGYEKTILLAVEETENALSDYLNELDRQKTLALVARDQGRAAKMAREQYKAGVTSQLDVLVAEENLLNAENDLVLSEGAAAENLVQLYRALGEGWRREPPQIEAP